MALEVMLASKEVIANVTLDFGLGLLIDMAINMYPYLKGLLWRMCGQVRLEVVGTAE